MNIFVVGTGRCGTSTFFHACKHANNFTCGHETAYWDEIHFHDYPENHIEIGHTLTWVLSWLVRSYPDSRIVHIQRTKSDCVSSLLVNGLGPLRMFQRINLGTYNLSEKSPIYAELIDMYYDTINWRIESVVPKDRYFHIWLHDLPNKWLDCWNWMGCTGDFQSSLREWYRRYNSGGRGRDVSIDVT